VLGQLAKSAPDPNSLQVQGPPTFGNPLPVATLAPLSGGLQTPVMSSARGTNATITATLPAAVGKSTYITGFAVHAGFATAGIELDVQVTGIPTTLDFDIRVPTSAGNVAGMWQSNYFQPPLPSSATNTAIVVTVPAAGAGDSGTSVCAWGYQQ
jgi:hypothetical protein